MMYTLRELREREKFLLYLLGEGPWDTLNSSEDTCSSTEADTSSMPSTEKRTQRSKWDVKLEAANKVKTLLSWNLN
jgi:hypothetical protein